MTETTSSEDSAASNVAGGGRLRDALFPIYGGREVGKFLALAGIQFFIIFVLTLTRDLKDTLIITSCGAEAISFLKVLLKRQCSKRGVVNNVPLLLHLPRQLTGLLERKEGIDPSRVLYVSD